MRTNRYRSPRLSGDWPTQGDHLDLAVNRLLLIEVPLRVMDLLGVGRPAFSLYNLWPPGKDNARLMEFASAEPVPGDSLRCPPAWISTVRYPDRGRLW